MKTPNVRKLIKHVKKWRPEKVVKICTNTGHCQHRIWGECVLKDEEQLGCDYWKPKPESKPKIVYYCPKRQIYSDDRCCYDCVYVTKDCNKEYKITENK